MEIPEKILRQIEKLLQYNEGNASENELLNAMRIAKRLAAKYGLDLAEMEAEKQGKELGQEKYDVQERDGLVKTKFKEYENTLVAAVAELFDCKVYYTSCYIERKGYKRKVIFIGTSQDIAMAIKVYSILFRQMKRRALEVIGKGRRGDSTRRRSYLEGFAWRLYERAKEKPTMDTKSASTKYALVVVNKKSQVQKYMDDLGAKWDAEAERRYKAWEARMKKLYGKDWKKILKERNKDQKKRRGGGYREHTVDASAYSAGQADGAKVDLNFANNLT